MHEAFGTQKEKANGIFNEKFVINFDILSNLSHWRRLQGEKQRSLGETINLVWTLIASGVPGRSRRR